jgi:hypothetical protein
MDYLLGSWLSDTDRGSLPIPGQGDMRERRRIDEARAVGLARASEQWIPIRRSMGTTLLSSSPAVLDD